MVLVSDEQVAQREGILEVKELLAGLDLVVGRRNVGEGVLLVRKTSGDTVALIDRLLLGSLARAIGGVLILLDVSSVGNLDITSIHLSDRGA